MYSCACSLSSNPIDLYTVMTCECWQTYRGMTALLCASFKAVLTYMGVSIGAIQALLRLYEGCTKEL